MVEITVASGAQTVAGMKQLRRPDSLPGCNLRVGPAV